MTKSTVYEDEGTSGTRETGAWQIEFVLPLQHTYKVGYRMPRPKNTAHTNVQSGEDPS